MPTVLNFTSVKEKGSFALEKKVSHISETEERQLSKDIQVCEIPIYST